MQNKLNKIGFFLPNLSVKRPANKVLTKLEAAAILIIKPSNCGESCKLSYAKRGITVNSKPVQLNAKAKVESEGSF